MSEDEQRSGTSWVHRFVISIGILIAASMALFWAFPGLILGITSPYLRFTHQNARYYSQMARACDDVLRQHPDTSHDSVHLSQHAVASATLKIEGDDPSLPKIIKRLNPKFLLVSKNRVVIIVPREHMGGFAISWDKDQFQTNDWILNAGGEGASKTVYRETKP